jgi:serine protease
MSESSTSETRERSPYRRWIVIAAAAIPATLVAGTMMNGSWSASAQVPTTTTTTSTTTTTIAPSDFVGITPVRVLDTRGAGQTVGVPSAAPLAANQTIDVQITGLAGIPANATSVAVNVTIDDDATLKSFITVWPTGQPKPLASTNNAEPGFISPVSALMKLGTAGKISVFNQQGAVNVIIDVTGYFVADPGSTSSSSSSSSSTTSTTTTPT